MILESGSVKLRCALGLGAYGSRPLGGRRGFLPCASSSARGGPPPPAGPPPPPPPRPPRVGPPLRLARGDARVRVAVDEQLDHQARVVGRIAALLLVAGVDRRQIERTRLHQIGAEMGENTLRHPP